MGQGVQGPRREGQEEDEGPGPGGAAGLLPGRQRAPPEGGVPEGREREEAGGGVGGGGEGRQRGTSG